MAANNDSRSSFALILEKLLDETNLFDRLEWAEFLSLSGGTAVISQWLDDQMLPQADQLRMVLGILRESDNCRRNSRNKFCAEPPIFATIFTDN